MSECNLRFQKQTTGRRSFGCGTLFHGPTLRMIRSIDHIDMSDITVSCEIDPIAHKDRGYFQISAFNHFADDALLQAPGVWGRRHYGKASLPLKIEEGTFFRPIPFQKSFLVSANILSHNESKIISDVTAYDTDGTVYSRLCGVETILSKSLNEKFRNW